MGGFAVHEPICSRFLEHIAPDESVLVNERGRGKVLSGDEVVGFGGRVLQYHPYPLVMAHRIKLIEQLVEGSPLFQSVNGLFHLNPHFLVPVLMLCETEIELLDCLKVYAGKECHNQIIVTN